MSDIKTLLSVKKFRSSQVDTGLGDELIAEAAEKPEVPAKANHKPAHGDDGTIRAKPGDKLAGAPPDLELDLRAWRATGRNAPINTKVRPEFKKMLYQGVAKERRDLCEVLEEMILARYGSKK